MRVYFSLIIRGWSQWDRLSSKKKNYGWYNCSYCSVKFVPGYFKQDYFEFKEASSVISSNWLAITSHPPPLFLIKKKNLLGVNKHSEV